MTEQARPRLHAAYRGGRVAWWCETGLGQPESVRPASRPAAVARAGAPEDVVALLESGRQRTVALQLPVDGRVRLAAVPASWLSLEESVRLARIAEELWWSGSTPWSGPGVTALDRARRGVGRWVGAGYVTPQVEAADELDLATGAPAARVVWRLVAAPAVESWRAAARGRWSGLVETDEEGEELVAALVEREVAARLGTLPSARRSVLGQALVEQGVVPGGGAELARAMSEFAVAAASLRVEVALRVAEPAVEPEEGADGLWRLEVLVRTEGEVLRPLAAFPDPEAVLPAVDRILDDAGRVWPPLAEASRSGDGVDRLIPPEDVVALVDSGATALRSRGVEVLLPRAWARVRPVVRAEAESAGVQPVDTGLHVGSSAFAEVGWEVLLDGVAVDEDELRTLAEQASELVSIRGRWVRADPDALRRAARFLESRGATGSAGSNGSGGSGAVAGPLELARAMASGEADGLEVLGPSTLEWSAPAAGQVAVPEWFRATLRPYQTEGLAWLAAMAAGGLGAVLADDMGLGKTVQVLALTAAEAEVPELGGPTLVVAPLSLVGTWRREAERFAPRLRVHVHHGASRVPAEQIEVLGEADLVVTTYGTATRDVAALSGLRWRRIVADEAQTIKNPQTATARALRALTAAHRVALTGTPVENRLDELRSVLDWANPGLFGSARTFRARFAVPIEAHRDETAAARLRTMVAPFVLRRVKSDPRVAPDLPDKIDERVDAPLTPEQASLYKAVVEEMLESVRGTSGTSRKGAILAGLTALKQVCDHPAHYLGDGSPLVRGGRHRSGKVAELDELLTRILEAGERVLVFTQYRTFGDMLLPLLDRRGGRPTPFLHGGVGAAARTEMVARFQEPDGPPILLASLKAGGTGLTLTRANHVVHLDRWWNPAVESQATDRVHRIGQDRTVTVHTMVCPGTVEERIDEMLAAKSELADLTVGSLAGTLTALDDEALAEVVALGSGPGEEER